jgi:hypothetical protein
VLLARLGGDNGVANSLLKVRTEEHLRKEKYKDGTHFHRRGHYFPKDYLVPDTPD